MWSSVLLRIDRVRSGLGPACFLLKGGGLRGLSALGILGALHGSLGARLFDLALDARLGSSGVCLLLCLDLRPVAVDFGGLLGALFLDLRPQLLGFDLRLDPLLLELGFLLAALGLGSRLGGLDVRVSLGLLKP